MKHEEKKISDQHIKRLIENLTKEGDNQNAAMFVRGDSEFQEASFYIKGDIKLLASTFHHHMDNNEEFRRLILSIIGSFLAKNPEEERQFIAGLEVAKNHFGIN